MPLKTRVVIVDDSLVVRRLLSKMLGEDPEIEVVGTAANPIEAQDVIEQTKPDVLTLDIEMPKMDGLTFLGILMEKRPMPVVVMSSVSQKGSSNAIEALTKGAFDVLAKPYGPYSVGDVGKLLVEKVKAARGARVQARSNLQPAMGDLAAQTEQAVSEIRRGTAQSRLTTPRETARAPMPRGFRTSEGTPSRSARHSSTNQTGAATTAPARTSVVSPNRPVTPLSAPPASALGSRRLILLGASTGGTEALKDVLTQLPAQMPGMCIVQHIPAYFSKAFADRLNTICALRVKEAEDGDRVLPGHVLIAPGDYHMVLERAGSTYRVRLNQGPQVWHQRPAVDILFRSAVETVGKHALAGILTGMGRDGADGLLSLLKAGAATFSQDEQSCVVYGMPKAAWEQGASRRQLPLDRVARHLVDWVAAGSH